MAEVNESIQGAIKKIAIQDSILLAIIYTAGHILIAMTCNYMITGASFDVAAMDALIEPVINGFWFYALHKIYRSGFLRKQESQPEKKFGFI